MNCLCCGSSINENPDFPIEGYLECTSCGLVFRNSSKAQNIKKIEKHYQDTDPHKRVAKSKIHFFRNALYYLSCAEKTRDRKLLDVGCGYGYFLKMAEHDGWKVRGVELVRDAVIASRKKVGEEKVVQGFLKDASFSDNFFDAITLWDVIAIMENPMDDINECYRIMEPGGKIGIRTRNLLFEKLLYGLFTPLQHLATKLQIKIPYVFNRYCFSGKSVELLLSRAGFVNIQVKNSPLTSGDPYGNMKVRFAASITKGLAYNISRFISWVSNGKWIIGPSLLIWAEKQQINQSPWRNRS